MNELVSEALEISDELPGVIMVGAVAVMLQTKRSRASRDVDIGIASKIDREEMIGLKYIPIKGKRDSWVSPRQIKVDVYRSDLSEIPIKQLEKTADKFDFKNGKTIRCACVEALVVAKYRACNSRAGPNDKSDLELLIKKRSKTVDWRLEELCKDQTEFESIKQVIRQLQLLEKR